MNDATLRPAKRRPYGRAALASVVIIVVFAVVMRAGALPVMPPAGALARLAGWPATAFVALLVASMLTKYWRYHFLLAPIAAVPLRRVMTTSCIAMALVTILPMRLGEMSRPAMLRKRGEISGWSLAATVAAERIIDGVAFGLLLLVGLVLARPHEPVPVRIGNLPVPAALVPKAALVATGAFGVAMVVMTLFYWRREQARFWTERLVGLFSGRLAMKLAAVLERTSNGLRFMTIPKYTLPYLGVTVLSVALNVVALQALGVAVGLPYLSWAQASVVLGVLAIGFALPNAPGFFGAVQLSLYAALALYVSPDMITREGATFVFLYYVGYLGVVFALAIGALLVQYAAPEGERAVARPHPAKL